MCLLKLWGLSTKLFIAILLAHSVVILLILTALRPAAVVVDVDGTISVMMMMMIMTVCVFTRLLVHFSMLTAFL